MKLTISIAQIHTAQADPEANLKKGEARIQEAAERGSDLICFPEMWTTGFNWEQNRKLAGLQEETIEKVSQMAKRYHIWINGTMLTLNEEEKISNTSILFDASGNTVAVYHKTHLFTFAHEEQHMTPGKSLCLADTPWGLMGLSICYEIRFPEIFRTYALRGAKIVLSPIAFPHPRLRHWKILSRARAIENQMYLVGINHVGSETFGPSNPPVTYFGASVIIDPWGETVIEATETEEELLTATIDLDRVDEIRSMMKVLSDRRPELYDR
jgi:predicted amidohydrolase